MGFHGLILMLVFVPLFAVAEGSGKFILEGDTFINKMPEPVAQSEGRVDLQYDRDFRLSKTWTFKFHPAIRATSAPESWSSQAVFDPREMNFERERGGRSLRLGFFTPKWEGTDGVNPMDIASVKDWSDPLRAQTLASAGVQWAMSGEHTDFEVFYVPKQTKSLLFGKNSPWLPRSLNLPLTTDEAEVRLPSKMDYIFDDREEYDRALLHNYGLRLQMHGDWGDFAIAGFEGAADWPMLRPVIDVLPISVHPDVYEVISPLHLMPIDYRRRTGAAYLSWTWGTTLFRTSIRHDQPMGDETDLPGWSEQGIFGLEQSFAVGENAVTLSLQGAWGRRAESLSVLSMSDLFDRAILWGLRWPIGESWSFLLSGFSSQRDSSAFSQIEITHRWSDEWTSEFFFQELSGPPTSLPGLLGDRDRAGLKLVRAF